MAENLRRYRSGVASPRVFSSEEIDRYPEFGRAEDINRTRFESQTFTATTRNPKINDSSLSLEDGKSVTFDDNWDSSLDTMPRSWNALWRYMVFGQTAVRSRGQFKATRRGDEVEVTGNVRHGLRGSAGRADGEEDFDFNPGQPGSMPGRMLEDAGKAAPFTMSYNKLQDVAAQLQRQPNGTLVLRRSTWGAMR